MARNLIHRMIQLFLVLLVSVLLGVTLLAGAFLLPTKPIITHVQSSLPILIHEKDHFSLTPFIGGTQLDNFTEAVYLNQAMIGTENASLMACVLSGFSYNAYQDTNSQVEKLSIVLNGGECGLEPLQARFFNGYEVFLKLFLFLFSYSHVRQLNLYLCLALSLVLCWLMIKRGLQTYLPAVILSLLFLRPLTVALNMTYVGFYYCTLIPCILMLKMKRAVLQDHAWLLFEITGAAVFYFNMNYFQLLSFAMPLMFFFLLVGFPSKVSETLRLCCDFFIAWFAGYAGMMVMKWILYAFFIDTSIVHEVLKSMANGSSTEAGSRFYGLVLNLKTALGNFWWNITEVSFLAFCLLRIVRTRNHHLFRFSGSEVVCFLFLTVLVLARYLLLSNHVIIHYWTTYRIFMIPILAVNVLLTKRMCAGMSMSN